MKLDPDPAHQWVGLMKVDALCTVGHTFLSFILIFLHVKQISLCVYEFIVTDLKILL
jgi:hypothetical protein